MSPRLFDDSKECTLADIGVKGSAEAIVSMCEQRSAEWFNVRLGILTGSNAELVITSQGKAATGQTRKSYQNGLIAERLLGYVENTTACTPAMERGTNLEPQARAWYEFHTGRPVTEVGFVFKDSKKDCGVSPDGLCADRGLELKALMHKGHIGVLLADKPPTTYLPQCFMLMWATGLPATDLCFYTPEPELPNRIFTIKADPEINRALDTLVPAFCAEVSAGVAKLKERE